MTTYSVHLMTGQKRVIIGLDGYEPNNAEKIGTFDMDTDRVNSQTSGSELASHNGDHPFVNEARKVLADHLDVDVNHVTGQSALNQYVFLDQATNAPLHDEDAVLVESDGVTGPNASSQRGGVVSNAGEDGSETEANGLEPKGERRDTGAASQPAEKGADHNVHQGGDNMGENFNAAAPGGPKTDKEKGQNSTIPQTGDTGTGTGQSTNGDQGPANTSEETANEGQTETVAQLKDRIAGISDKAELEKIYAEEQAGAKRATALAAIEARAKELETT